MKKYLTRSQLIVLYNHFSCDIWHKHINDLLKGIFLEDRDEKIDIPNRLIQKAKKKCSEGQLKFLKDFDIL